MNRIEKAAYNLVKSNPKIKNFVRNVYQSLFDLVGERKNVFYMKPKIYEECFHGFHDCSPVNSSKLLFLVPPKELDMPAYGEQFSLKVISLKDDTIYWQGKTSAVNFHKGSRQQWLSDAEIVYNYYDNNKELCSKVVNIHSGAEQSLNFAVDAVSQNRRLFSSFDYYRLEFGMPGYGYVSKGYGVDPGDPVFYVFDTNNNITNQIGIETILESCDLEYPDWFHFFTHSSFSPDGKEIAVFLRSVDPKNVNLRSTILCVINLKTNSLRTLKTSGMVSHYCWLSNEKIVGYFSIAGNDGHYVYDLVSHNYKRFYPELLTSDGHHSVSKCGQYVLVDTYPDRKRMQRLWLLATDGSSARLICEVHHPKAYQSPDMYHHWSCDLHPRFHDGGFTIDLISNGNRSIAVFGFERN